MPPIIAIEKLEQGKQTADKCVHFGFCTAVCPTYVLDGEENDSPRGRIALIKEMLASGKAPDAATITHVDRCLSCLSCATTCAAGVEYRTLVDTAREYIEAAKVRPLPERWSRRTLSTVLTTPWLLNALSKAGGPFNRVARGLPGSMGALGRLANAPAVGAFAARAAQAPLAPLAQPLRRVALLDGCAQSVLGAEINASARRLLHRCNVEVLDCNTSGQCCGAMKLHMGYPEQARRQAAILVDTWAAQLEAGELDTIVVTTSGCGAVMKHYRELFANDPDRVKRAEAVEAACRDISELLNEIPFETTSAHIGARVAYHDSCSLNHGQKITREPRNVLARAGFAVLNPPEGHLCCGSAGTYNILQPQIAERLGRRKAENIRSTQPEVVTAANMGCLVQISMYLQVPVAHIVQLIDWATGGPTPRGLEHFEPREPEPETLEDTRVRPVHAPATETSDLLW